MWSAGIEGFALSMGLILAIGPQNIFVLRQGLLRSHVFAVCLVCSLADALLITVGVLGLGAYLSGVEGAEFWISMVAALFMASASGAVLPAVISVAVGPGYTPTHSIFGCLSRSPWVAACSAALLVQ